MNAAPRRRTRRHERGSLLIAVLLLTVVFAALSVSLLSTAEMQIRVQSNARDLERADRAAQSAVEWGAALVKANGLADTTRTATFANGTRIATTVSTSATPNVVGGAIALGVAARYAATVTREPGPYPHALLTFGGSNRLDKDLPVTGDVYFGGATPFDPGSRAELLMNGNLLLTTNTTLPAGRVVHTSGATSYGVAAITEPAWNTLPFTLGSWSVPVTRFTGAAKVSNRTITGIVVVTLLGGQRFTFENCTIQGTVVVPSLYPPILDLLGSPSLVFEKTCVVTGGTAETGNLAILAPSCDLETAGGPTTIRGVTFARSASFAKNTEHDGLLILRTSIDKVSDGTQCSRSPGFVPMVPVGIAWTGDAQVRTRWLGKQ